MSEYVLVRRSELATVLNWLLREGVFYADHEEAAYDDLRAALAADPVEQVEALARTAFNALWGMEAVPALGYDGQKPGVQEDWRNVARAVLNAERRPAARCPSCGSGAVVDLCLTCHWTGPEARPECAHNYHGMADCRVEPFPDDPGLCHTPEGER